MRQCSILKNIFLYQSILTCIAGECEEPKILQQITSSWVKDGLNYVSVDVDIINPGTHSLVQVSLKFNTPRIDGIREMELLNGMHYTREV
jgi:hypothetical protein